jgi:hypothetical protein
MQLHDEFTGVELSTHDKKGTRTIITTASPILDSLDRSTTISHHTASHFHPLPIVPLPPNNTFSAEPHALVSKLQFPLLSNAWRR